MNLSRRGMLAASGALALAPTAAIATGQPIVFPFRVSHNQPWTVVFINGGKDALPFLIDTGSNGFAIAEATAKQLKLTAMSRDQIQGAVGRGKVNIYRANQMVVANAVRDNEVYLAGLPMDPAQGVCGLIPAAHDGVMAFDFDALQISMTGRIQPETAGYDTLPYLSTGNSATQGSVDRMGELSLADDVRAGIDIRPVISVELDGAPVRLMVDTGASGAVFLNPDFVKAKGLWDHYPKAIDTMAGTILKPVKVRKVRGESLKLGRVRFQNPIITLGDPARTAEDGSGPVDGLIGMELLRRFNLVTNPYRREFFLKPNGAIRDVYRYDRAGTYVEVQGADIRVTELAAGGPAEKAGLKMGDKVTGWAGADGYYGLLWALEGPPGSVVRIQVQRDGQPQMIEITLAERI